MDDFPLLDISNIFKLQLPCTSHVCYGFAVPVPAARRSAHVEYQRFLSGLIFKLGCYSAYLLLMINGQDVSCTI